MDSHTQTDIGRSRKATFIYSDKEISLTGSLIKKMG
jgi:hypothetical protein